MSIVDTVKFMIGLAAPNTDGAFQPPPPALPAELVQQHHAALMDSAREQLRAAHVERAAAQAVLTEAEGKVTRALEVITTAERLDAAAAEAEAEARAAAKAWAAAGCHEDGRPDPDLLDRAAVSANRAIDARVTAAGAQDALPGLRRAVQDARLSVSQAEDRVRSAAIDVLGVAAGPRLAQLARLRDEYEATLAPLAALRHLARSWGPGGELAGFSDSALGLSLEKRFKELTPLPPSEPDVRGSALDLRERALRLLEDAGAPLEV